MLVKKKKASRSKIEISRRFADHMIDRVVRGGSVVSEMATEDDGRRMADERMANIGSVFYRLTIIILGFTFGLLHRWHVSTIFENVTMFSHMSDLEREMTFRTEMGMYYSYYKTIVESENFIDGMYKLKHDNLSEYNNVIDATTKYNLLPEIAIGFLYHVVQKLDILPLEKHWIVEREHGKLLNVNAREGLRVPVYFYLEIVWFTTIFTAAILFFYSIYLSSSIYGGLITILLFFANHSECTRVQWSPPLRESFAYPMLLYEMYNVTMIIREYTKHSSDGKSRLKKPVKLLIMNLICSTACLCTWQFSQFIFATQIATLLLLKWLRIISNDLYEDFYWTHIAAIVAATTLLQLTNFTLIISSLYLCLMFSNNIAELIVILSRCWNTKRGIILEIAMTIFFTLFIKSYILYTQDDAHVFDILKSKLTSYKDFHTMLYTCAPEFDFLGYNTFEAFIVTFLLQTIIFAGILALYYWYKCFKTHGYPRCIEPDIAYNGIQTGIFIIMAVLIMRLKLFMTPHLCIIAGLVSAKRYLEKIGQKSEFIRTAFVLFLISSISYHAYNNAKQERSVEGTYYDISQEKLLEWIRFHTPEHAAFAGKMSLMPNIMLSNRRPIVNNPYYESKEMRDRTMKIYQLFSRKNANSVYHSLRKLKVNYVVIDESSCFATTMLPKGCQMIDLWDILDNGTAKAANKSPLCPRLFKGKEHQFQLVYINAHYAVLRLRGR